MIPLLLLLLITPLATSELFELVPAWESPAHHAAIKFESTFQQRVRNYNLTVGGWLIDDGFTFNLVDGKVLSKSQYLSQLKSQNLKIFTREIQHSRFDNNGKTLIVKHVVDGVLYQYNFASHSNLAGFLLKTIEKSKGLAEDAVVDFEDNFEELAMLKGASACKIYLTEGFFLQEYEGKKLNAQQFLDKLSKQQDITTYFQYPKNPHFDASDNLIVIHNEDQIDYEFTFVPKSSLKGKYQISQIVPAK